MTRHSFWMASLRGSPAHLLLPLLLLVQCSSQASVLPSNSSASQSADPIESLKVELDKKLESFQKDLSDDDRKKLLRLAVYSLNKEASKDLDVSGINDDQWTKAAQWLEDCGITKMNDLLKASTDLKDKDKFDEIVAKYSSLTVKDKQLAKFGDLHPDLKATLLPPYDDLVKQFKSSMEASKSQNGDLLKRKLELLMSIVWAYQQIWPGLMSKKNLSKWLETGKNISIRHGPGAAVGAIVGGISGYLLGRVHGYENGLRDVVIPIADSQTTSATILSKDQTLFALYIGVGLMSAVIVVLLIALVYITRRTKSTETKLKRKSKRSSKNKSAANRATKSAIGSSQDTRPSPTKDPMMARFPNLGKSTVGSKSPLSTKASPSSRKI